MSLKYLGVPENNEILENDGCLSKGHKKQQERSPNGQVWNNMRKKCLFLFQRINAYKFIPARVYLEAVIWGEGITLLYRSIVVHFGRHDYQWKLKSMINSLKTKFT